MSDSSVYITELLNANNSLNKESTFNTNIISSNSNVVSIHREGFIGPILLANLFTLDTKAIEKNILVKGIGYLISEEYIIPPIRRGSSFIFMYFISYTLLNN